MADVVSVGPYPTVEFVTNLARAFANDMVFGPAGITFTDNAAFMLPFLNSAIMELQTRLENNGIQTFKRDNVILTPITPVASDDPSTQIFISYNGYFDGVTLHATPVLPSNCITPLELSARTTGSNLPFRSLSQPQAGLPSSFQMPGLGPWEWREDALWLNGCNTTMDLKLRYIARLPLIGSNANFSTTTIAIRDSSNALGYMLAKNYAMARGAQFNMTACDAQIEKFVKLLVNREVRQRQEVPYRRRPYGDNGGGILGGNEGY